MAECTVNHEMEAGVFFALLDKQRETEAMLKRAVTFIKDVTTEFPHWGEAEEIAKEADEFLARIDVGAVKEWKPGEEPF